MTPMALKKKLNDKSKKNYNIAKIENSFIEAFMMKNNSVTLKILFYIARSEVVLKQQPIMTIRIDTKRLCEYCHIEMKTLYRNIDKMRNTSLEVIKNERELEYIQLIPRSHYYFGKGILEVDIYQKILNKILEVEKRYTIIDVPNLMKLHSKHSLKIIQILEMIKQFSPNVAKRKHYTLEEWNGLFGTNYKNCYEFERRVLKEAKKELDSVSKLTFLYEIDFERQSKGRPKAVGFTIDLIKNS